MKLGGKSISTQEAMYVLAKMQEAAIENLAIKVKTLLADQWGPLKDAGWGDSQIQTILNEAVKQCDTMEGE